MPKKVAVIGGGAAGMMAAIKAAEKGHSVTVFEKMEHSRYRNGARSRWQARKP